MMAGAVCPLSGKQVQGGGLHPLFTSSSSPRREGSRFPLGRACFPSGVGAEGPHGTMQNFAQAPCGVGITEDGILTPIPGAT